MKVIGIIPARIKSSRFPAKPLADIMGMPMVIHVLKRAELAKSLDEVYVATDSRQIAECVSRYGGNALLTSKKHKTGTDRIAQAARRFDCDIVVNIQGDEPLVNPKDIEKLVACIKADSRVNFATLVSKTRKFKDVTECKVVLDENKDILYMSRSDIPSPARSKTDSQYKLYCVVAFRKKWLKIFSEWSQTRLEKIEYIEYLRILEKGCKIRGVVVGSCATSVDRPEDLKIIHKMFKKDKIKFKY